MQPTGIGYAEYERVITNFFKIDFGIEISYDAIPIAQEINLPIVFLIKDRVNELFNGLCHVDTLRNYEVGICSYYTIHICIIHQEII